MGAPVVCQTGWQDYARKPLSVPATKDVIFADERGRRGERQDRFSCNRAYDLYWIELVQIKVDTVYVERYRDWLTSWLSWFAIGRAIVSVGALGSWFAGVGHGEVWGGIIVASQVAEAVVNALPLSARQKNLSAFALALEAILIDALLEWEDIHSGEIGARDITRRRRGR
jgi:hypothetical protein